MFALIGGTVFTMCGKPLQGGTVLVEDGKIAAVCCDVEMPVQSKIIDVSGKYITPGLIDAHTHLRVYSEPSCWANEDGNEMSQPVTAEMDVIDAIYPADLGIAEAYAAGVTTVLVALGSANPIGGQCLIMKTVLLRLLRIWLLNGMQA